MGGTEPRAASPCVLRQGTHDDGPRPRRSASRTARSGTRARGADSRRPCRPAGDRLRRAPAGACRVDHSGFSNAGTSSLAISWNVRASAPCFAMTTRSSPALSAERLVRKTSRTRRLIRLRATAFPTFELTVTPSLVCSEVPTWRTNTKLGVCIRRPVRCTRRNSRRRRRRAALGYECRRTGSARLLRRNGNRQLLASLCTSTP